MNQYRIPGRSHESIEWFTVPELEIAAYQSEPPLPVWAAARLCWSDRALHVRMSAREQNILARFEGDFDPVCRDSCLEMFLSPIAEDGRYFNFEFNPNGASYFGFGYGRADRMRLHPMDVRSLLSIRTAREEDMWIVLFDVPFEVIRLFMPAFAPRRGHRMRANFYKCGDDISPNHELMWSPITNGNTDFYQPEFFGELVLA